MTIQDIYNIYDNYKKKYGYDAYKYISQLLKEVKSKHKKDFEGQDHEQSWRSFKGKSFERLIEYIIKDQIKELGLELINGNKLERTKAENLSEELNLLKRNLLVDYGKYGCYLPDVDLIIYRPQDMKIIAVLSIKVTLRERIAQTGYWKTKLSHNSYTKHIKLFFITPDEDNTLFEAFPTKKGRAIVEIDLDGGYVLSETNIQESNKVKMFDKFIDDLKELIK